MLPEPTRVLHKCPSEVLSVEQDFYTGLFVVSVLHYEYYNRIRIEQFTCCKSIAMHYKNVYDDQHRAKAMREKEAAKPRACADKPDEFGITERGYTLLAILGIVLVVLLITWLVRHIPAMI